MWKGQTAGPSGSEGDHVVCYPLFPCLPPGFLCSRRVGAAPPKNGGRGDGRVFFKVLRPSLAQLLQKSRGHS